MKKLIVLLGSFISIFLLGYSSSGISCGTDKNLKCSPDTLYLGDTLIVNMKAPHGGEMYIKRPDKSFYFVVFKDPPSKNLYSLYSSQEFENMTQIVIITNQTKAAPWVYSKSDNELIFTKTGKYLVRVGESLESEIGKYEDYEIYYINEKRIK